MTKLSALPIAAILCLGLASPSSAFFVAGTGDEEGSLGVSGYFTLGGEKQDHSYGGTETSRAEFFDDFELAIRAGKGDFAAVADLGISDTEDGRFEGHNSFPVFVDNYWMEWAAADNLTVKAGEYAINFGRSIGVYDAGGHNVGVSYRMDMVDLGLTVGKVDEDDNPSDDEDKDVDQYVLTANANGLGPFTRLGLMGIMEVDEQNAFGGTDKYTANFLGLDFAVPVGPVALSGEFGVKGGERYFVGDLKGSYLLLEAGLDEVMPAGFGLTVRLFDSSKDYTGPFTDVDNFEAHYPGGNLYAPAYPAAKRGPVEILFDEVNPTEAFTQALILSASYAWSDRLSLYANLVPLASVKGDQADVFLTPYLPTAADSGDSWGTEYDLGVVYAISKNASYTASYAKFTEGDVKTGDITQYYNSLTFRY